MRVLIVGCGYVGFALAVELRKQGHDVSGLRRTPEGSGELQRAGIVPIIGDITRPGDLEAVAGEFDWVVNAVSSTRGGVAEYREVYCEGMSLLIRWAGGRGVRKFVYTSSTSVYGQTDGSWVTEESVTAPVSETSALLVEAERVLLDAAGEQGFPGVVLRVAGIYGPGRGYLFQQYLKGEARLSGAGTRIINMIHRDDVVGAIIAALERGQQGRVYNAADDEPVTQLGFFTWLALESGGPLPPPAGPEENGRRKRGLTNKRVSNRRLREELGYEFRHPTFRQGYGLELAKIRAEGKAVGSRYAP